MEQLGRDYNDFLANGGRILDLASLLPCNILIYMMLYALSRLESESK